MVKKRKIKESDLPDLSEEVRISKCLFVFASGCAFSIFLLFFKNLGMLYDYTKTSLIVGIAAAVLAALFFVLSIKKRNDLVFSFRMFSGVFLFTAVAALLFALLLDNGYEGDGIAILFVLTVSWVLLYIIYLADGRRMFFRGLISVLGIGLLYVARNGGGRFGNPLFIICAVILTAAAVFLMIKYKKPVDFVILFIADIGFLLLFMFVHSAFTASLICTAAAYFVYGVFEKLLKK